MTKDEVERSEVKVKDIMESQPFAIGRGATVAEVMQKLSDVKVGGLPIVDEAKKVVGYIGNKDILRFLSHRPARAIDLGGAEAAAILDDENLQQKLSKLLNTPIAKIAAKRAATVNQDATIQEASDVLYRYGARKIAVVDDVGKLVGVIQRSTVIRYIFEKYLKPAGK
ncbi:MAG: CBS domain-containing protein [Candidatus Nomurabacteria bacterium]|jgi:DHA2 family lincomycin resistance protein-like MFS transporter|nr:CBS domain-containing protein [Candidatus Nomurabacteria bacterium]